MLASHGYAGYAAGKKFHNFKHIPYLVVQLVATAELRKRATSAPTPMRCLHKATRVKQRRRRRHKVTLPRWAAVAKDERSELHDSGWMGANGVREVA